MRYDGGSIAASIFFVPFCPRYLGNAALVGEEHKFRAQECARHTYGSRGGLRKPPLSLSTSAATAMTSSSSHGRPTI